MIDSVISGFFDERKAAWIKDKQKSSMSDDEVLELHEQGSERFSLEVWIPDASKRAGQMAIATHPCTFSHPSARKNKNGYVTPIISENTYEADGLLRSGNVHVEQDALGNAAAIDVYKFLSLKMTDGRRLIDHIQQESELAKKLLTLSGFEYESLRDGFLAMIESGSEEMVTSSKIKQVYFPLEGDYHQLSLLSNSGIIFELKRTINSMRFGEEIKAIRDKKKNNETSDQGYSEIYHLTTIGYGGTNPRNISVLNNQNGGKAYLLHSMPPSVQKRGVQFPKRDFFRESMRAYEIKDTLDALGKIFVSHSKNIHRRKGKEYRYQQLIDRVIEKAWVVRSVSDVQYFETSSHLESYQKIWLLDAHADMRESEESWLDELVSRISSWILHEIERVTKLKLGANELQDIKKIVESNREAMR